MTEPIGLRILQDIQTHLRRISVQAGFFHTVQSAAVLLDPEELLLWSGPLPVFLVVRTPDGSRSFQPSNRIKNILQVTVLARMDAVGNDPMRKAVVRERLLADVEKVLTSDAPGAPPSSGITRGGLAIDTRLLEPSDWAGFGSNNAVLIEQPVNVHLVRVYGQP